MRRLLLSLLLPILAAGPALAAATPWQQVAPGARLRLISSDERAPDGTTLVGLELDMPEAYKTYWRRPGEVGIPTELDLTGSAGVGALAIAWPFPRAETVAGLIDYVYRGPTVLPVALSLTGDAPHLRAAVTMGVCSDVCLPVKARFDLPLSFTAPDPVQSLRLRQAEAQVPIAWPGPGPAVGSLAYDAAAKALRLAGLDPAIDAASLIATSADPGVVFGPARPSSDRGALLLPLRGTAGTGWVNSPVSLTFTTERGAFEVAAPVTP
jgi:DsbC/DsbD-like thiol-disulfide interchange protein